MGCGTSKQSEADEETLRSRRASQVQVDAVQRAEAAYRRQRMALQKEATSYRRASIEIEKARLMKEMYGGHGGVDKNLEQEPAYGFGFHTGRSESLTEAAAINNCPDFTITEVSENENNEYATSTKNVEREIIIDSLKEKEKEQISSDDPAVISSEPAEMLANKTGTALEGETDEDMNALEPNLEEDGVTGITNMENPEIPNDNMSEVVEPASTLGETLSTCPGIPNDVNSTIENKRTTENEPDIKKDDTMKTSLLNDNTEFSNEILEIVSSIGTDNTHNEAREGEKMNEFNKTLES